MSRSATMTYSVAFPLPWEVDRADIRDFNRLLRICLVTVLIFGGIIPWVPVPEVDREELEELPPQLARIVMEKPEPVVPPPPPKPEVQEEPVPEEQPEPEPEPEPVPEEAPPPEPTVADAQQKASISGLLAFKDTFADMRDAVDMSALQDAGVVQQGAGEAASIDRSIMTSKYGTRSTGVNVTELSRDTGGVALAGRETTKVEAPVENTVTPEVSDRRAGGARERSVEDVRRIFDANKGAIFAIYNRALRRDPTLQGKVVLELVIDPTGRVTEVKVVASELADEALVAKIVNRIRLFDFGERQVGTTTISYPVHFLPT